ncbi:MAG TPA: glycoside hydrolase family 125 protein [Candidatus Eremiobacteraceae bacterium]|nr:glycoside hydrolase family 125 protein [Candidatus Eremiobacteraceae bacterium]
MALCLVALASQPGAATGTSPLNASIALTLPGMTHRLVEIDAETLFHTADTDFRVEDDQTIYVQTGDIPAMWLRDSSAQMLPYVRFGPAYPQVAFFTRGVIQRNAKNILTSPYANAFTSGYRLWEEKWEVDSLAYPIVLTSVYWSATHDRSMFTVRLHWAFTHIVETYECEQQHATCSGYRSRYLSNHGKGAAFAYTGMIWGAFRPSDDPVRYPYNIPQQLFAAKELESLAHQVQEGYGDTRLAMRARQLAAAIRLGIDRYGQIYDFRYGWMYPFEVDGLGNYLLMDDANLPDLLALPAMGLVAHYDPLYTNSRRFSLSHDNPYYYRGRYGAGLGSPHTRTGWVWPLGIVSQALTASTPGEVAEGIEQIRALDGKRGLLYESVDPDRPWHYTRGEFGWANAAYAELIFRCVAGLDPAAPMSHPLPELLPSGFTPPRITTDIEAWNAASIIYAALTQILRTG